MTSLNLFLTRVTDLSLLKGMKLTSLNLCRTQVTDVSPLKGMPLTSLNLFVTGIADLSPLKGMPLTSLSLSPANITNGLDIIRNMNSLTRINGMPATEFWKKYDAGEFDKK